MMWVMLIMALGATGAAVALAYDRAVWKWRATTATEQSVRLQRKVVLLEHDLMRAEDMDRLWHRAKESDARAERALIVRLQQELDGWRSDDEWAGPR